MTRREKEQSHLERLQAKLVERVKRAPAPMTFDEVADENLISYLQVRVAEEHFLLPVRFVEEVVVDPPTTAVPRVRGVVRGVFLHRGALVPLVRTAHLVSVTAAEPGEAVTGAAREGSGTVRAVVVGQGDEAIALEVTEVLGIVDIPEEGFKDLPSAEKAWRYVHRSARLGAQLAGLLEVDEILATPPETIVARSGEEA